MKNTFTNTICTFITALMICGSTAEAQVKRPLSDADKAALEGIIVEKYFVYDGKEKLDTTGGCLPKGAVTYRIFVDLKPGYNLQAVYGVNAHPLFIKTTTYFYNNNEFGQGSADYVKSAKIAGTTAALDSWITIGAACDKYMGVPKAEDKDGSVLKIASLEKADGLVAMQVKPVTYFGAIPNFFNRTNTDGNFNTNNGSWAVFGGAKGATEDNKILIAQLTTDGELSYELNLQVGTPTGGSINYVAKNPEREEIKADALTHEGGAVGKAQ